MKKLTIITFSLILLGGLALGLGGDVFAQGGGGGTGGGGQGTGDGGGGGEGTGGLVKIENPLEAGTIPDILKAVAKFLFNIALAFVTIMVLWAGFQILTAAGNPEGIDKGKRTLTWAIIGTVVILLAGSIATLTANILGGSTSGSQSAGTAGCKWVATSGRERECVAEVKCASSEFTAPRTLNCKVTEDGNPVKTQADCEGIPAKTCVKK